MLEAFPDVYRKDAFSIHLVTTCIGKAAFPCCGAVPWIHANNDLSSTEVVAIENTWKNRLAEIRIQIDVTRLGG